MVADDLGRVGHIWPETDLERTDLETVVQDLLEGQYKNSLASSVSTPAKAGLKMCRLMSPRNCAGAAIFSCGTFRLAFRISSNDTRGMSTGSWGCIWFDRTAMDEEFLKELVAQCRGLAEKADGFTRIRLLSLAARYDTIPTTAEQRCSRMIRWNPG
jgi:hypothetical protein